jgi:hypothetical protein
VFAISESVKKNYEKEFVLLFTKIYEGSEISEEERFHYNKALAVLDLEQLKS